MHGDIRDKSVRDKSHTAYAAAGSGHAAQAAAGSEGTAQEAADSGSMIRNCCSEWRKTETMELLLGRKKFFCCCQGTDPVTNAIPFNPRFVALVL